MILKNTFLIFTHGEYEGYGLDCCAIVLKNFDDEDIEQKFLASDYKTKNDLINWMVDNGFIKLIAFNEINYDRLGQ